MRQVFYVVHADGRYWCRHRVHWVAREDASPLTHESAERVVDYLHSRDVWDVRVTSELEP